MRIEDWAVVTPVLDPYAAPETQPHSLSGKVFNHPRFEDGQDITTSSIVGKTTEGEVLTTSGSSYELGRINPQYEKRFPNAKKRFLGSLSIK